MNLLLFVIAQIFFTISAEDRHLVVYKGPAQMYSECRQYLGYHGQRPLNYPPEQCENYCTAVLAHLWDIPRATVEIVRGIRFFNHFLPVEEYLGQCEQCIQRVRDTVPLWDQCRRVDEHLECFVQNASINFDRSYFFHKTPVQHQRVARDCVDILQVKDCQLGEMVREGLVNRPEGRCLVRCFLIREKLYSEANGVDLYRVVMESGLIRNHREERERTRRCVAGLQREFVDRCTLAARIGAECFDEGFWKVIEGSFKALISY